MKRIVKLLAAVLIIFSFLSGLIFGCKSNIADGIYKNQLTADKQDNLIINLLNKPIIKQTCKKMHNYRKTFEIGAALCYLVITEELKRPWVRAP